MTTTDPLEESEDEMDENTRLDLRKLLRVCGMMKRNAAHAPSPVLRLQIINRLRGKEPTPEPELRPTALAV